MSDTGSVLAAGMTEAMKSSGTISMASTTSAPLGPATRLPASHVKAYYLGVTVTLPTGLIADFIRPHARLKDIIYAAGCQRPTTRIYCCS